MNHSSISGKVPPNSLPLVIELTFSVAGLILALSASCIVHAQSTPVGNNTSTQSPPAPGGEYNPGETPSGQEYSIIKKGEPDKSEAAKKGADRSSNKQEKREDKPGTGSIIDRDPRETSEGSGPDPFGRY
ncbi:hypothetical protein [Nitrosovibrio sp. Nv4]|uniref:hypothetical protein n=1 Tax=Nitrosovibrio sp. Nv4 TaxID=1945880 RepID=UPI000BD37F54|nr:hypothetical protein [Nitrosovibrio sp. Nv4]SOD42555.1 hypothetical protein SAMN06298226_2902 [Nitrosovibrio sp. Nv4]